LISDKASFARVIRYSILLGAFPPKGPQPLVESVHVFLLYESKKGCKDAEQQAIQISEHFEHLLQISLSIATPLDVDVIAFLGANIYAKVAFSASVFKVHEVLRIK